jgi:hypothetical protein
MLDGPSSKRDDVPPEFIGAEVGMYGYIKWRESKICESLLRKKYFLRIPGQLNCLGNLTSFKYHQHDDVKVIY